MGWDNPEKLKKYLKAEYHTSQITGIFVTYFFRLDPFFVRHGWFLRNRPQSVTAESSETGNNEHTLCTIIIGLNSQQRPVIRSRCCRGHLNGRQARSLQLITDHPLTLSSVPAVGLSHPKLSGHTRHLITLASMLMILSLIHEQKPVLETLSLKCWVSIGYFTLHSVPLVHLPTPDFMFRLKLVWKQWFLTSFSRDSFNCLRMSLIGPSRVHFCAFEKLARWLC